MKKEKDYKKEVAQRKFKKTNPIYYFIYYVVMHVFVGKKYRPHYEIVDDIKKCKTGCFLIWNHLSRLDHINAMSVAYPRRINIVCAYNEFFRSHLYWAFKKNNIIPKKQYTNDLQTIKGMSKILKMNGVVAFAPEGLSSNYGTNQPIVPGTGHLLKHYKVPVYFMELRGQYLTNHKTCLDERYGKTYAKLSLMFSSEDLERLSEEEIEDKINLSFKHDEYEWQKKMHIKWDTRGRVCHHLNDICYKCPKCGSELNMTAEKDYIKCNVCGNGATMDDYYDFHPYENSIIPESPSKWVLWEREQVIKEIRNNPDYKFVEHVKIGTIPNNHLVKDHKTSEVCGEGTLTIDHTGMHYVGTKFDEPFSFDLDYKQLYTLITMLDISYVNIYVKGEYYDIFPEHSSGGKMLLLVEEMHRLHVNYFKNFKWYDYLYEPYNSK